MPLYPVSPFNEFKLATQPYPNQPTSLRAGALDVAVHRVDAAAPPFTPQLITCSHPESSIADFCGSQLGAGQNRGRGSLLKVAPTVRYTAILLYNLVQYVVRAAGWEWRKASVLSSAQ